MDVLSTSMPGLLTHPDILHRTRRTPRPPDRDMVGPGPIFIEDLVQEWKHDTRPTQTLRRRSTLDLLLDETSISEMAIEFGRKLASQSTAFAASCPADQAYHYSSSHMSHSYDSVPSLSLDSCSDNSSSAHSIRSASSASIAQLARRRTSRKAVIFTPSDASDHPLDDGDTFDHEEVSLKDVISSSTNPSLAISPPRIGSNIAVSLQSFRSRALSSLQSISLQTTSPSPAKHKHRRRSSTPSQSNKLWSYPNLFPRLSPETRPGPFQEIPTITERHYPNPTPPTLDQMRSSYREALHATLPDNHTLEATPLAKLHAASKRRKSPPNNIKVVDAVTTCTMQDSTPVCNEASLGSREFDAIRTVRQREPRENRDFLRVVVLEMNMRRQGKLEDDAVGRARIWLPPRLTSVGSCGLHTTSQRRSTPLRWSGITPDETDV